MDKIHVYTIEYEAFRHGESNGITIKRFYDKSNRDDEFSMKLESIINSGVWKDISIDTDSFSYDDGGKWSYIHRKGEENLEIF